MTVVVSSLDSTEENSGSEESSDSSDSGKSYETDDKEENGTDVNESDADTSVKETEDSTAENEGRTKVCRLTVFRRMRIKKIRRQQEKRSSLLQILQIQQMPVERKKGIRR